jgi:hypothetical protein
MVIACAYIAPHVSLCQAISPSGSVIETIDLHGSHKERFGVKSARGMLVVEDFDKKLSLAVKEVPSVSIGKYKVKCDLL